MARLLNVGVLCCACVLFGFYLGFFKGWDPVPSVTGGACYFESGRLTSSLPGREHLGNVTNEVFRSNPVFTKVVLC